jgi:hypothetical protein
MISSGYGVQIGVTRENGEKLCANLDKSVASLCHQIAAQESQIRLVTFI